MKKRPRLECPDAAEYDAVLPPTCATERFLSCDSCVRRWQDAQAARIRRANSEGRKK